MYNYRFIILRIKRNWSTNVDSKITDECICCLLTNSAWYHEAKCDKTVLQKNKCMVKTMCKKENNAFSVTQYIQSNYLFSRCLSQHIAVIMKLPVCYY